MKNPMKKYYIGVIVLGVLVVGLIIYGLMLAVMSRQDTVTFNKATSIADTLNNYVDTNSRIPDSLAAAGIKNVPTTITYTKLTDSTYKFCMYYKEKDNSAGFDITSAIWNQNSSSTDDSSAGTPPDSLFIDSTHQKGNNCQTIDTSDITGLCEGADPSFDSVTSCNVTDNSNTDNLAQSANDVTRMTDINALQSQLEAYFAENGYYPTFANMNDASWIAANLKGLDSKALIDPKATSAQIAAAPAPNIYSYAVTDDNGASCDNVTNDCTQYTLTATYDDGSLYTKSSLN